MKKISALRKLMAIAIALALMLSCITVGFAETGDSSEAVATGTPWDGKTLTQPTSGSGNTEDDPMLISTPAELAWVINSGGNSKYYKLTADIYINDISAENWTANANSWFATGTTWASYHNIEGTGTIKFSGHIDGDGHTVYGLYTNGSGAKVGNGLIPVMNGGTVKRLAVSNASFNSRFSGGIVGVATGSLTIEDCVVTDSVLSNTVSSDNDKASGGIMGYANTSDKTVNILRCTAFNNTYDTSGAKVGGILGNLYKATVNVDSCYCDIAKTYGGTNTTFNAINSCALGDATLDTLVNDEYFQNCAKHYIMSNLELPVSKGFLGIETNIWNGFYHKPTAGEDGVYLITCPEEFAWMVWSYGDGVSYRLTTDIYLNDISVADWQNGENLNEWFTGTWNVGYAAKKSSGGFFTGTVDGDGHVVYGLYNVSDGKLGGLIPECKDTTVKNLGLSDSAINAKGAGYAGGIIGFVNGATVTAENCFVENTTIYSGNKFDGAIIGYTQNATNATVKNCYATSGHTLVDYIHDSATVTIQNSYSFGNTPYPSDKALGTILNTNVYTDKSCTFDGVTILTSAEMTGKNALTAMSGLSAADWYAVEGRTPMLRVRGTLIGDADENGVGPEFDDISALRVILISNPQYSNGDYNRDGDVDICDLVKLSIEFSSINLEEITALYGDYYGIEMSVVSDQVDALGEDTVNYIFITDIHYTNGDSAQDKALLNQMNAIAKMAEADDSIDFIVIGGDTTTGTYSTKEACIAETNEVLAPLKNCSKPILILPGNHDDNCYHVYSGDKVYKPELIVSDMDWTQQILAVNSPETIVHDKDYANSKYYYYDLPEKKTRVVCLDAIDYRAPFDENGNITEMVPADFANNTYYGKEGVPARQYKSGASYWDYSAEQLKWLTEQALTEKDYNYIFVSHMGIDSDTNSGGETVNAGYRDKLRGIISAYQSKTTYSDSEHTADFTDFSGKILSYQFGHIHVELTTYSEDIDLWQICSASANVDQSGNQTLDDIQGSSINNKELDWNPIYRALGTDSEAYFDIMSVTEDAVYKFNIGTGSSETMSYPN